MWFLLFAGLVAPTFVGERDAPPTADCVDAQLEALPNEVVEACQGRAYDMGQVALCSEAFEAWKSAYCGVVADTEFWNSSATAAEIFGVIAEMNETCATERVCPTAPAANDQL